ncbi:hypothetical protein KUTeg_004427 [Tegillarca granosa]|uniref:Uncharacterized protein n=1 Tax=Tegillarca granosa TaxID=220873 RepID=A0ABQ9FRG7_TEGGR|nr:hypothetical protein KUTeg_004427 [Tegillarca granosa]
MFIPKMWLAHFDSLELFPFLFTIKWLFVIIIIGDSSVLWHTGYTKKFVASWKILKCIYFLFDVLLFENDLRLSGKSKNDKYNVKRLITCIGII